jgi:calcineurin-like phosphoesterase family protein
MTTTFFIGDTHFGHKNIIKFDSTRAFRQFATIEEHDEELVRRWNSVVSKNDTVWHLGDFAFGSTNVEIAGRLNGHKKLVLGNHDHYPSEVYLKHFHKLYGTVAIEGALLSHIPVHPGSIERFGVNIHGHLHSETIGDVRYVCVSCEQINLTPVVWEEISGKIKALSE